MWFDPKVKLKLTCYTKKRNAALFVPSRGDMICPPRQVLVEDGVMYRLMRVALPYAVAAAIVAGLLFAVVSALL